MNIRSFCILEREQRAHTVFRQQHVAQRLNTSSVNERTTDKSADRYYLHLTEVSGVWYVNFPFRHYEAEKDAWEDPNH